MEVVDDQELPEKRWRSWAWASLFVSTVVLVVAVGALVVATLRMEPRTPEECRPYRLEELESLFGREMSRPYWESEKSGGVCFVETRDGSAWLTVGAKEHSGESVDAYRKNWAAEGRHVSDVAALGDAAVWSHKSGSNDQSATAVEPSLAAFSGNRRVLVVMKVPFLSIGRAREIAERAARTALAADLSQ